MDTPFVLHITNSPPEIERISALMDSFQLPSVTVQTIQEGLDRLDILNPSVILLSLPPKNYMERFHEIEELAKQALDRFMPLFIIGDPPSDSEKEKLFKQGPFDFVTRPVDELFFQHLLQGRITFKRKLDQALSEQERVDERSADSTLPRALEIILIDDDPITLEILKQQFSSLRIENHFIEVKKFTNGADFIATDWYDRERYYAIILDGIMPKMTGFEVLTHIRSTYPQKNILIFMLTSRSGPLDMEQSLEAGADDYITKPFKPKEVALRVHRLTKRLFK
ncbi:response regulator [Sporosarcina sp. Te-1]|uniref:response regulator n=1 Tax=Sporosarcina sp. Te-1 TaxID=2818390 RepID=UPI001A9FFCE3|nr:response regulator [Sporosarcina sp. Te-1]QTD39650.1 response regulator [Sporosarcina sp. Te-1]